mmetsp:Transcript_12201/g.24988  ORF Transcript_12201/g.24988 Transcript_12201/m.24988 type:complete len:253 (-) Transcript_12201:717-1475(-)
MFENVLKLLQHGNLFRPIPQGPERAEPPDDDCPALVRVLLHENVDKLLELLVVCLEDGERSLVERNQGLLEGVQVILLEGCLEPVDDGLEDFEHLRDAVVFISLVDEAIEAVVQLPPYLWPVLHELVVDSKKESLHHVPLSVVRAVEPFNEVLAELHIDQVLDDRSLHSIDVFHENFVYDLPIRPAWFEKLFGHTICVSTSTPQTQTIFFHFVEGLSIKLLRVHGHGLEAVLLEAVDKVGKDDVVKHHPIII